MMNSSTQVQPHKMINERIISLLETDTITYPQEAEFIESVIRMTERRKILEVGMYTGFCTLHMIRAVLGGGHVTSIDFQPKHDREFFSRPEIESHFQFVEGRTPEAIYGLEGNVYDFVFVDSDHSPEHTEKERVALNSVTKKGSIFVFHDVPRIQSVGAVEDCEIRKYMNGLLSSGEYSGVILPTPHRLDCERMFGPDYDSDLSPHMAVLIKR